MVFTKNSMTPIPHPPYSPDLTPVTFVCFLGEKILRGKCFADVEEVKQTKNGKSTKMHQN